MFFRAERNRERFRPGNREARGQNPAKRRAKTFRFNVALKVNTGDFAVTDRSDSRRRGEIQFYMGIKPLRKNRPQPASLQSHRKNFYNAQVRGKNRGVFF